MALIYVLLIIAFGFCGCRFIWCKRYLKQKYRIIAIVMWIILCVSGLSSISDPPFYVNIFYWYIAIVLNLAMVASPVLGVYFNTRFTCKIKYWFIRIPLYFIIFLAFIIGGGIASVRLAKLNPDIKERFGIIISSGNSDDTEYMY